MTSHDLIGRRLGGYTVLSLLGVGGMGVVYRARDEKLGREVAIKVLPAGLLADPDRRARFDREARLLAALNHPHIGAIYGVEEGDGVSALVLELVEGPTLAERLEKGAVGIEEALSIAWQIAEALDVAHDRGIVHRDLKPANVKLTGRGQAKLLDFGVATQTQPLSANSMTAPGVTNTGQIVGTVGYMSPEQVRGVPVDRRSDQFSLGIILFEMLTGRTPFARDGVAETLAAILRDKPPTVSELNPSVPPPLQWLVDRCLAKDPNDRYASTSDLAKDLSTLRSRLLEPAAGAVYKSRAALPKPRTPLVGRETELTAVRSLLLRDDVRLVTLTGVGGTGKTRLALQLAAELGPSFGGGVYFVPLAAIADPGLVSSSIMRAVGGRDIAHRDPTEVVKESLAAAREPVLLLLDNFERVLDAAPLLTDLLESCEQLKVLVTSQAVLRVYGEHDFAVPPLALPPRTTRRSVAELSAYPSVALFVQRATAVKPDFKLTPETATVVVEICGKLDGLPLAIELAAARVRTLTPAAILQRLQSRFDLLTGGARDMPARQQTLRATVEWSFGLLTEDEQKLFRRLAVFVGGCTLEAAEAVCNAADDLETSVLDAIESLAGKSLIQQIEPPRGETRFTMLETIRDYAIERFASSPDEALARRAHAAYCLVLAEEGNDLTSEQNAGWLERCDLEQENLRAALDCLTATKNANWGLRLAVALFNFWRERELYAEGRERYDAVLALQAKETDQQVRAVALENAGHLANEQGDNHVANAWYEGALAINKALGNRAGILTSINSLAANKTFQGDHQAAISLFEECGALSREAGDEPSLAQSLSNMAHAVKESGDPVRAKALCEQALSILARYPDLLSLTAWLQSRLGDLECELGNAAAASQWYERSLTSFERTGDLSWPFPDENRFCRPHVQRRPAAAGARAARERTDVVPGHRQQARSHARARRVRCVRGASRAAGARLAPGRCRRCHPSHDRRCGLRDGAGHVWTRARRSQKGAGGCGARGRDGRLGDDDGGCDRLRAAGGAGVTREVMTRLGSGRPD